MTLLEICAIGIGLAVDASCVCTTNGFIYKPNIKTTIAIVLPFCILQGIMPLIGYFGVKPISIFSYNHIIALVLLCGIGFKMLVDGFTHRDDDKINHSTLTFNILIVQAISTSIDALSVGVTLSGQSYLFMFTAVTIIAIITFVMCFIAVQIGIKIGTKLNSKAEIFGGIVLILLGIKLFLDGFTS
ncbi:MAG: hypothetical protein ATN34_04080 [Epulopiscium sp. Nele67-Bin002]|nr:MAG: hypothetical protein ATN34_04080 [Epulopiscium sp. Nele67-Bin002]